ncbi:MAG: hypothetical protein DRH21_00055 [Deltaproteobacteria bacterium]|nr:MAG: hypothetical protein DRH21_00055 [Deltaproteobacteria bacterium]
MFYFYRTWFFRNYSGHEKDFFDRINRISRIKASEPILLSCRNFFKGLMKFAIPRKVANCVFFGEQ